MIMLSLRYLCWMRRNLSFCFRSVRCWVVGKWGSKWLVWLVKFPTYSNGQMSLEIPSKYGFIDGFSIVVGGDTPSPSRQTLTPWDDSGFHPRWTTRLFWTLDIFFSCITGVVGILRVGVRQLVDRWKFSGGCVVGCLWYLLKYLLLVGKWPLLSEVSQVTWATNNRTNGGLRKMNASVSGTLVSWISQWTSPS